jgi:hypothetical protein
MADHAPGPDWTCTCGYDYFGGSAAYSWQLYEAHRREQILKAVVTHRVGEDQRLCPSCLNFYGGVVDKVLEVLDGTQ